MISVLKIHQALAKIKVVEPKPRLLQTEFYDQFLNFPDIEVELLLYINFILRRKCGCGPNHMDFENSDSALFPSTCLSAI